MPGRPAPRGPHLAGSRSPHLHVSEWHSHARTGQAGLCSFAAAHGNPSPGETAGEPGSPGSPESRAPLPVPPVPATCRSPLRGADATECPRRSRALLGSR